MAIFKEQYWHDYKNIINSIFNQKPIDEQPDYLLCFGIDNVDLIKSTYATYAMIRDETERGKVLDKHPISYLIVRTNSLTDTLNEIPHKFIQADFSQPQQVKDALINLGIQNFEKVLSIYLGMQSNLKRDQLKDIFKEWNGLLQKIIIYAHYLPPQKIPPDDFVLALAECGFIPKAQHQNRYPKNGEKTESTLNLFEHKSYIIRHPKIEDVKDLLEIEKQVWASHLQQSKKDIERLVRLYAQESLVIEEQGKVVAVNFAQALPTIDNLAKGTWKTLAVSPQTTGPVIRLITLNVDNTQWNKEYGDHLLDFLLYWCSLQENVTSVIGATRCSQLPQHSDKTMEEYIQMKDEQGLPVDPILHFHACHGAKILGLIPNYRQEDVDNQGYGVLIEYSIKTREQGKPSISTSPISVVKTRHDIKQIVEQDIAMILGEEGMQNYTISAPLMDMGFDSLRLLELRSLLAARLDFGIPTTFFFHYGTVEKIVDYFAERILDIYKDWFYKIEWTVLSPPIYSPNEEKKNDIWVIFADEGDFASQLVAKMKTYEFSCIIVKSGVYYSSHNDTEFSIRPDSESDFEKLLTSKYFSQGVQGVIYLWGLFKYTPDEPSLDLLQSIHKFSCIGLINFIKAYSKIEIPSVPRIFVGSWALKDKADAMSLAQWPYEGLSRTIQKEYPDFRLKLITVEQQDNQKQSVDYFFLELFAKDREEHVVWREGKRCGARLIRLEIPELETQHFDENASYLLVGSFGLGLKILQWYVEKGAKHLVFVSPEETPSNTEEFFEMQEFFDSLKARQIAFDIHANVDISNFSSLEAIIKNIPFPLKGVTYFATKVDDDLMINQDWPRFEALLKLKVAGAWNLHLLTKHFDLDHFVIFSSMVPFLDSSLKANRSMGNAFLDALAIYRFSQGLPALAINWSPWGNLGVLVGIAKEEQILLGLRMITPGEGLNVLDHIPHVPLPRLIVAPMNWKEIFQPHMLGRPFLIEMEQELGLRKSEIINQLQRTKEEEREEILLRHIRRFVRRILQLRATAKLDDEQPFGQMGLLGLQLLVLRNYLQQNFEDLIHLPYNFVQETTTIEQLSQVLYPMISKTLSISPPIAQEIMVPAALNEPIAIIGMGCRFPKGVNNPEQFYQFLKAGIDGITEFPKERLNGEEATIHYGSFLNDVDLFDPKFFGISPREAKYLDPQARLLLEVCWEAFENAGIAPASLIDSATGVFVGITTDDYTHLLRMAADEDAHNAYIGTGNYASAVVGRISHFLGLQGPNMAIDTACSSALVAIHQACQSLQVRDSNIALAGGVQLNLLPDWYIDFDKASMLSPDGHCKTFDASANGYVRGEGCGIVILKRLSEALRDGDNIQAVIRATNVNQDGSSTGFTVPNERTQVTLIKRAMNKANMVSAEVDYVEAHGTGTPLGDPIEVEAIGETYGQNRTVPLLLGTVKSNIGHLEAAAGIAGVMKVVLSLQNELIPKNLNFNTLNPKIDLNFPAKVVSEPTRWPKNVKKRVGAVSSFGFSGTNAHAILEEAPEMQTKGIEGRHLHLVALSAKSELALADLVEKYLAFIKEHPEISLGNLAYTANTGRNHFKNRMAVIAQDLRQFQEKLQRRDYVSGIASDSINTKVGFIHETGGHFNIDKTDPSHHRVYLAPDTPWNEFLPILAEYYIHGNEIDWKALDEPYSHKKVSLPTYPFQRERCWVESIKTKELEVASLFYQTDWQPKPLEKIDEKLKSPFLIIAEQYVEIEGLQSKTIKSEQAVTEVAENPPAGILWFVSGEDSLKHALKLVQALSKLSLKPSLYFITHGIQPVGPITDLDNATFNGFYKTLELEMPDLNCRHIDLRSDEKLPLQELLATDKEGQVAYAQGIRYVPRLVHKQDLKFPKKFKIDSAGSYLITGGFGGLGLKMAEWLAKQGATHLVLAGRRMQKIEIPNAKVETVAIDICQRSAVDALMQKFGSEWPELKGIIHAAGVPAEGINLTSQDWSLFKKVLAPKTKGSWNLHEASLTKPLDFFILFSSLSSVLGLPRGSDYASANAYMDALAHIRLEKGLPALAIGWGNWAEVGMAAKTVGRKGGMAGLKPDIGIKALELALTQTYPHLSIVDMDWKLYPHRQNFLEQLTPIKSAEAPLLLQCLSDALPSERKDILIDYLQQTMGKILGTSSLNPELGFFEAGMDSLMSVELRNKLQMDIGNLYVFPSTLGFDYPSVHKLAQYFEEHIFPLIGIKAIVRKAKATRTQVETDSIAIIGLGCRFPGGANHPQAFWDLLKQGYDGITEIPPERWDIDSYYDPDPEAPGKMYVRKGGFLDGGVDTFDANFFGISPREAEYMDPQQRLLLEVAWEALENACINPLSLTGSATGVFIGVSSHDYSDLLNISETFDEINPYQGTGNTSSVSAGRLSYFFGLQGPCLALDTACSSSLVAIHSASNSLQRGECQLAIAGGVNILLNPGGTIFTCKAHMLSKDGYCKTFDEEADGYVRSEGCGMIVLKRLSNAIIDKDPILGVIRATEVNQDGASSGLTVPNGEAQTVLIRQALKLATLEPNAIDYIEAHGTGTSLGDPIEVGALVSVFSGRQDHPLMIGTVKTNIGHLEAAAGVAGVIKTVLALNHEMIPPHLHFQYLNPHISLDSIPAQIPLTLTPWQRSSRPRIAGVSSFGFSGTNAHAIIEEPPVIESKKNLIDRQWHLLTLSAKTQAALDQLLKIYTKQLPEEDLADIAFTANTGRAHFPHRVTVLAKTRDELLDHLQKGEYLIGQAFSKPPKITFIFAGQTVDNTELMENLIFNEAMERSCGLYEYALFELWKSWGIVPDYVAGEGIGDIVAAIAAGMITLEEGLKLIGSKDTKDISYREPQIGFISSWTGEIIRKEGLTADYWKPHENIRNIPEGTIVISTQSNWKEILQTLAQLYLNGIQIDWKAFDTPYHRKKVSLPNYPFQRERYWANAAQISQIPQHIGPEAANRHPFLIHQMDSLAFNGVIFESEINAKWPNFVKDHQIYQFPVIAGATYISTILAAAKTLYNQETYEIQNIEFSNPLILSTRQTQLVQTLIYPPEDGDRRFIIFSRSPEETTWTTHIQGFLNGGSPLLPIEQDTLSTIKARCPLEYSKEQLFQSMLDLELALGPHFKWIEKIYIGENELLGQLRLPVGKEEEQSYVLHPGFIDSCFQSLMSLLYNRAPTEKVLSIPFSLGKFSYDERLGKPAWVHVRYHPKVLEGLSPAKMILRNEQGYVMGQISDFIMRPAPRKALLKNLLANKKEVDWFYTIAWQPQPLETTQDQLKAPWLIVSQEEERIEGLQSNTTKPEQAAIEVASNPPAGILWFASGENSLEYSLSLVQALGKLEAKPSLYFITHGIQPVGPITDLANAPINGFYKTLRLEMPDLDCRHIDLALNEKFPVRELLALDNEGQVAYSQGIRYVPRLLHSSNVKRSGKKLIIPISQSFQLEISVKGVLENLYLRPKDEIPILGRRDIAIEVKAAGLNFRDVLNAMGLYPGDPGPLGLECAGIVTAVGSDVPEFKVGDPIMGHAFGCFASNIVVPAELFTLKPSELNFTQAAAIPGVFATAYDTLINLAKIKPNDKILIHAAAGGVGLAAIQVAQQAGAEIYATASNQEKQAYLRSLGVNNIYNSRTLDYAQEILRDTSGKGVDVVLNSLSGEGFIEKTVSVCNKGARFVEIGKKNIWSKEMMHEVRPDIEYFIFALDDIMVHQSHELHHLLQIIVKHFVEGKFKALPCTSFPITDAESAFEYLQRAKNIGKVVLTLPETKQLKIDPAGSYMITGGLGGLGLKVAEWLVKQGAKHLVLAGRRPSQKIEIPNAAVETIAIDISQKPAVDALMQKFGREWPELKGIIHAAGVIDDGILPSQDWSKFEKVFEPKIQGSWNLHEASLNKPLDLFILFSSVASSIGSPGQINYSSANAYMDALAAFRHDRGLPALAISWGPWAEVGLAAKLTERHRAGGYIAFKPDEGIRAFELALRVISYPHISIANVDWKLVPYKLTYLSELKVTQPLEVPILLQRLTDALHSERKDILTNYLQHTVGKILGLSSINPEVGFFDAGMDSLMAVELRNRLQTDIGSLGTIPSTLGFDYPSVQKLTQYFEEHIFPLIGIKTIVQKAAPTKVVVESDVIAIIGMGCRFPGGANDPQAFWELLKQGYDGITEIPQERWDIDSFYDPDPEAPGKMYVRRGGFLNTGIDTFDANFFGISPREAEYMDPQQRLLLEVAWEALEQACINPLSVHGSPTGIYLGVCTHDYSDLINKSESLKDSNVYLATGNASSILAGRLSYFLGLQGPCIALDTACSSSLVAIHTACKNLQSGECQLALAGGVNVILSPDVTTNFCKGHMLSKDGYCKTFDAEADGYVRGEGCGVVVLKRLSDAIRDEDPILGVIRATEVNQDGASSGLTVPNGEAQAALIHQGLEHAKLEPSAIDYIEAHGTGTSLGDTIELGALSTIFKGRKDHPLLLGTVKTNIGHLEAAAGVAGVIKTVLALTHEVIPQNLHFQHLNPHIALDSIPVKIPLTLTPWQRSSRPRIAGVSSFGFSGTNAHAIIEEAPLIERKKNLIDRPWHLLTLSAKTQAALDQLLKIYTKQLPEEDLADIAFTANTGRAHFPHRVTVLAKTRDELLDHLQKGEYLIGQAFAKPPKITFIFTGQTVDNTELMETSPVFKEAMERSHGLYEYALFELWKSWGIFTDYVAGEGIGEFIAAIAAGIISLEDGLKLIVSKDAKEISYREPQIGFISSWTGQIIRKEGLAADYWKPHDSIRYVPEGTLVIPIQGSWKDLLQTLAQLYLNGIQIDWKAFDKLYNRKKVSLPTYPFQRERYWVEGLKAPGYNLKSLFYQIDWQPKPLEKAEEQLKNPWLVVSSKEEEIEGLQFKTIKPGSAVKEVTENSPVGILWFASGEDSLKHALELVQVLAKLEIKPSLYFITHGIQPVGPITDLESAPFNGFYKTLKLEMANLDSRSIDLGSNEEFPSKELLATDKEGQVAYRYGIRYAARLVQRFPVKSKEFKINPTGSYLITGGLGGLGLKVAAWLVKQGAKHLVLVGRRTPKKIEIPNAIVETIAVDISQRSAVNALMQKFGKEWPELKGIIHTAGIAGEGNYLTSQDWGQFEKVFAPKIQGSWNLHEASLTKSLDFFVLFSSLSSVLGLPRESEYASANAYMDALAYFRHERGLPALAINWGNWAEVGMAANIKGRKAGMAGLKPDEGMKALELALSQTQSQIAIVDMEWRSYPHQQNFVSKLILVKPKEGTTLIPLLVNALPSERKDILNDYLQQTVGKILGLSSIDPEIGFFEAGMDSLMAVELRNQLQTDLGEKFVIPAVFVFKYPSINKIEEYISKLFNKVNDDIINIIDKTEKEIENIKNEVDKMSFEELDKLMD